MLKYLFIVGIFISSALSYGQTETVRIFEEQNEDGYNLFFYQSVLRLFNKDENPDFNKLIKNLEYVKLVISDSTGVGTKNQFVNLNSSIIKEGFEEIVMLDNKSYKATVYQKEIDAKNSEWVAFLYTLGRTVAFEMKGNLDVNYLHAFNSLDAERVQELAKMKEFD